MNDKLRQFEKESKLEIFGLGARRDKWETALEKYAELIIEECANIGNKAYSDVVDFTYIGDKIKDHFRVEGHKGWVCSKCGIDRTRAVCPKGHTASITGECPMTAEAQ
jgi:hypothetical protein